MIIFWLLFSILQILVLLQGLFSYKIGFFSKKQLQAKGHTCGLPFISHLGMWLDFWVISFLVAYVASKYCSEWSALAMSIAVGLSVLITGASLLFYARGSTQIPACHLIDGKNTLVGWLHAFYMCVSLSVLLLFFWATKNPGNQSPLLVALILSAHHTATTLQPKYVVGVAILTLETLGQILLGLFSIGISYLYLTK